MLVIDILDFLNIFFQGVAQITSVVPNDFSCTMCFLFLFFFYCVRNLVEPMTCGKIISFYFAPHNDF